MLKEIKVTRQKDVWAKFAQEIEGAHIQKGILKSNKIHATIDDWIITIDTYTQSVGHVYNTYTRIRAPFVNKEKFNFNIHRKGMFSKVGKFFKMQNIDVGYPDFDEAFIIKGNDEDMVIKLFSSDKIRELAHLQNHLNFEIRNDDGSLGKDYPDNVNQLYFETNSVIKDIEKLESMYMLFVLVLNKLNLIGVADKLHKEKEMDYESEMTEQSN